MDIPLCRAPHRLRCINPNFPTQFNLPRPLLTQKLLSTFPPLQTIKHGFSEYCSFKPMILSKQCLKDRFNNPYQILTNNRMYGEKVLQQSADCWGVTSGEVYETSSNPIRSFQVLSNGGLQCVKNNLLSKFPRTVEKTCLWWFNCAWWLNCAGGDF